MINATPSSSSPSTLGGSPMPPPPEKDTAVTTTPASTPSVPAPAAGPTVVPPRVLPSHGTPPTHAIKPLSAPHQDIASLHKSLADKVNTDTAAAGSGATPPPAMPSMPTVDTSIAPPANKKSGWGMKGVVAALLLAITVVGAGAAYYLQTQTQDTRQRAFTSTTEPTRLCNFLELRGINENGSCPSLTSSEQMCQNPDPNSKNNISSYKNTYILKNPTDKTIQLTIKTSSNSCPEAYGIKTSVNGTGACWRACFGDTDPNTPQVGNEATRDITLSPGQEQSIEITADSLIGGQACGSMQLDLFLLKAVTTTGEVLYDKASQNTSQCGNVDNAGLLGWGFCQTGNTCQPPQTTKVSGGVTCYSGGKRYAVQGVSVSVDDKNYTTGSNGFYTSDSIAANKMVAARLNLPDTFNIQELDANNNPVGAVMQANKSSLQKFNPNNQSQVINAYNGCAESAVPNFMQDNCGGVTAERQTQCNNAPMKDGFKAPGSYEWCNLQGGKDVRGGFDFAIYNCVSPAATPTPAPSTPPAACNEACSPLENNCTQNATNTMSCIQLPTGAFRCRDTRFASQENCQAPATPTPTPQGGGGMCVSLCGVASATASSTAFSSCASSGGMVGTPVVNGYVNFKCNHYGQVASAVIAVSKDGGAYTNLPTYFNSQGYYYASYQVTSAGTYSANCNITPAAPGSYNPPQTELPPTGTQTACPLSDSNYSCEAGLTECARIGDVEMISAPGTGQIIGKYSCSNSAQVCCKKDPAKNQNPAAPICNTIPNPGGATPRCTFASLCTSGRIETNANCNEVAGSVCCIPNSSSQSTPTPTPRPAAGSCANGAGNCKSRCGAGETGSQGNGCDMNMYCCMSSSNM